MKKNIIEEKVDRLDCSTESVQGFYKKLGELKKSFASLGERLKKADYICLESFPDKADNLKLVNVFYEDGIPNWVIKSTSNDASICISMLDLVKPGSSIKIESLEDGLIQGAKIKVDLDLRASIFKE